MKIIATLAACFWLSACAAAPGEQVRSDVQGFEREQATERLTARGQAFAAVGDTTRAQEYLAAALEAGASDQQLTPQLIALCVRDGRYQLAIEHAERYLLRHPDDQRMRFVLGSLFAALGEGSSAERELKRVSEREDQNPNVKYALAVVMRDQRDDPLEADRYFRDYLRLAPHGEHVAEARASLLERIR